MVGKTIGHFRVLEQIGRGGMGVVYKAQDLALDRIVALKSLHPDAADGTKALGRLLEAEARTAATLDHPNICTIYEVLQTDDEQVFVAMAYYSGETVYQKLRLGSLARPQALSIGSGVAAGLAKAHRHGIIHQDIKPGNVMVTNDGVVKILDFGLARLVSSIATHGGTVAYMSPEQLRGERVSVQSDVWAWGILLCEMLTGRPPFVGVKRSDVIRAILEDPVTLADSADMPPGLLRILRRTLEKDPANRYREIAEARAELEQFCPQGSAADRVSSPIAVKPFGSQGPDQDEGQHDGVTGPSRARHAARRYTTNPGVHKLYLKARYQWNRGSPESLLQARENLTRATEEDPRYVPALCALAECHLVIGARALLPPDESWRKAGEAATKALALDPGLAEAHGCFGAVLAIGDFNWVGAEREFRRGLTLNPESAATRHWYAISLLAPLGRLAEAIDEASRAVESEPLSLIYNSTLSWIYYLARQWDLAAGQSTKTLEIDPAHVDSLWCLGTSYRQLGRAEDAAAVLRKLEEVSGGIALVYGSLGHYHARMGNRAEAERMITAMRNSDSATYCSPVCESWIHANLPGHHDAALDCIERAWAERDFMVRYIHISTALESLYGHPRFEALLQKMGLRLDAAESSEGMLTTRIVAESKASLAAAGEI